MFTLIVLTLLLSLFKGLHLIYIFQIKEYRFDRFSTYANERGLAYLLYTPNITLPAKSFRNILIFGLMIFLEAILFLLALELPFLYYFLTFGIFICPVISLVIIIFGVAITSIPATISREITIAKARRKVAKSTATFIGVTGSYGKTTVKEFIGYLLSQKYTTGKSIQNYNSDIGVAISLLQNLKPETEYYIVELGAYKTGEIDKASYYIPMKYAVLTGLGNQHLALYGSQEALITEESSPLYKIPEDGKVYINENIPNLEQLKKEIKSEKVIYGFNAKSDIYASNIKVVENNIRASIKYKSHVFSISVQLVGKHLLQNLLPAIALALDLGITEKMIVQALKKLQPIPGKLSLHKGKRGSLVINDAANTNVNGFIAAIQAIAEFPHKNKYIITKGIIELGVEKRESYNKILSELKRHSITLLTTDKDFNESPSNQIITFNDVAYIQEYLFNKLNKNSIVVLEGKFTKPFIDSFIIE